MPPGSGASVRHRLPGGRFSPGLFHVVCTRRLQPLEFDGDAVNGAKELVVSSLVVLRDRHALVYSRDESQDTRIGDVLTSVLMML